MVSRKSEPIDYESNFCYAHFFFARFLLSGSLSKEKEAEKYKTETQKEKKRGGK